MAIVVGSKSRVQTPAPTFITVHGDPRFSSMDGTVWVPCLEFVGRLGLAGIDVHELIGF